MLFPYKYVPHSMEKMQGFIDFIFFEVWCKAPTSGPFDLHLFDANSDLREVMEAFFYGDSKGGDFFYTHVERLHGLFAALLPAQVHQFRLWYEGNNDVEKVCANDSSAQLARYTDIAVNHEALSELLASFFKGLYSQSLLNLAALRQKIGDIDSHYHAFVSTNRLGKCPFCGISDLFGEHHSKREAYDHYLPKSIYPFNSINFKNLVPACHHCNSSYKCDQNPAYTPKDPTFGATRRKVFYPFSTTPHRIDLQVALKHVDIDKLAPADVALTFGPANFADQIKTWKDVYGIEERYRAKLISADAKNWLVQVFEERRWHDGSAGARGRTPEAHLEDVEQHTEHSPYANLNFLKNGFLRACKSAGMFDSFKKATPKA